MKYWLVFLFIPFLFTNNYAQVTHPGGITTLKGDTIQGEVAPIPDKTFFQGVRFTDASGRETDYLPGEIKGFFVNEDYVFLSYYEAIQLDTFGTFFFQNKFEDGSLKYLFSMVSVKEAAQERQGVVEIYMIDNRIVLVDSDLAPLDWHAPQTETAVTGGIITENGDTLRGTYTVNRSKLVFQDATKNTSTSFDINKLRGFYNNQATYYNVNVAAPGERTTRELCWVMVDGPHIQLVARLVDISTYERVYNNYYNDPYARSSSYYRNQTPTYRKVRSGFAMMFTIRNHKENKALNFLTDYFQAPTRLGSVLQLREWLKDYPALQSAALGNTIQSEKALVHLYNFHLQLKNADKN